MAHPLDQEPVPEKVVLVEPDKVVTEKQIDSNNIVRNAYPPASEIIPNRVLSQVETKAESDVDIDNSAEVEEAEKMKENSVEFVAKREAETKSDNVGPVSDGPEKEKQPQSPDEITRPDFRDLGGGMFLPIPDATNAPAAGVDVPFPDTERAKDSKPLSDFNVREK